LDNDTINQSLEPYNSGAPNVGVSVAATEMKGIRGGVSKNPNDYVAQSQAVNKNNMVGQSVQ
jgi:hypothetical protein